GRTSTVAPAAPVNTAAPQITGSAQEGQTVSVTTGNWTAAQAPTFTYQWLRCDTSGGNCAAIAAPTAATHHPTTRARRSPPGAAASARRATAAAPPAGFAPGAQPDASAPVIPGAPVNTAAPTISGLPEPGQTLTGNEGSWSSSAPAGLSDRWLRCDPTGANCADIGVTGVTYPVIAADKGHTLLFQVTASSTGGSATALSVPAGDLRTTAPPPPPHPPHAAP